MGSKPRNKVSALPKISTSLPSIEGAEYGITSDGFFELTALPKKVAVIGSGYIGVELAGVLNALGSEVEIFGRADTNWWV
jgi:glutathione reductase (NADPH)